MENGTNHVARIEISSAHRELINSLMISIAEGKRAESMLKLVVQGILQQGGVANDMPYTRSEDGMSLIPARITLTAAQLQDLQAMHQGQEQ